MRSRAVILLFLLAACGVPAEPTVPELETKARAGDRAAVADLLRLTRREARPAARSEAYRALLKTGNASGAAILKACRDADPVAREHALALAANLRLAGAFEEAVRALADQGFSRRYVAAWALGELGNPAAVGHLLEALQGTDELTAREAARSLVKLGKASVGPLVEAIPRWQGAALGYALRVAGELRDLQALDAVTGALASTERRADALWALGKLGSAAAAPAILSHAGDPQWQVRMEVARAVGLLGVAEGEPVLDALRTADPVPAVREWAARSLAVLRGSPQQYPNARGEWVEPESYYR